MLFRPDIKLKGITDITVEILNRYGIKALLLDVDNTMSTHHGEQLTEGLEDWLSYMQENGIKLSVLSNSTEKRVKPFAEKIGLDYISLGLKPLPTGFLRGVKRLGVKRRETAIVGDQIFTDTLGGALAGIKRILLTPIKPETSVRFKIKRKLEKLIYNILKIEDLKE